MGLLSFEALNGTNIPSLSAPKGLLATQRKGLLGLGGFAGPQPPAGLLGPYYDPAEEKRQKIFGAMTQAGIQLLTNGKGSFGEVLGQGLAGAVQGANQAGQDYRQDAFGYQQLEQQQADRQRQIENDQFNRGRLIKQDAWTNTEHQYTLEERARVDEERQAKKAGIMDWMHNKTVSMNPQQAEAFTNWATDFPEQAAKMYSAEMMPDEPQGLQSVGKGSTLYDPNTKTWIAPPAGTPGATQAIDDPLKISKNFEGSPGMSRIAQIAPTIKSMEKSLSDPSAMADLDFVYGLAKILDPTSVVRESEGKMVIDAQGIGPQMLGQLNKFMSGEQAMLPEIRQKLFGVAHRRAKELEQQANQERGHFSSVATENQFNPDTYLQQVPKLPTWADQNMQPTVNQAPQFPGAGGTGKTSNGVPWKVLQ